MCNFNTVTATFCYIRKHVYLEGYGGERCDARKGKPLMFSLGNDGGLAYFLKLFICVCACVS